MYFVLTNHWLFEEHGTTWESLNALLDAFLMHEIHHNAEVGENIKEVRVIVPPLPRGWHYMESDFECHAHPDPSSHKDEDRDSNE